MKLQLVKILFTALPLVGGPWVAPAVSADNDSNQAENPGRDLDYYDDNYEESAVDDQQTPDQVENELSVAYHTLESRYERMMRRLADKEQEELRRAYRKYGGDVEDPRFQERRNKIIEKYTRERYKVENKLGPKIRENSEDLAEASGGL